MKPTEPRHLGNFRIRLLAAWLTMSLAGLASAQSEPGIRILEVLPNGTVEQDRLATSKAEALSMLQSIDAGTLSRTLLLPGNQLGLSLSESISRTIRPVDSIDVIKEQGLKLTELQRAELASAAAKTCFAAATKISEQFDAYYRSNASDSISKAPAQLIVDAKDYERACLAGPEASSNPFASFQPIQQRIGILVALDDEGNWVPFCSGYVLDVMHVVTARHCFFSAVEVPHPTLNNMLEAQRVFFHRLSDPAVQLRVTRTVEPQGLGTSSGASITTKIDFIYLSLAGAVPQLEPVASTTTVKPLETAFVPGLFPFATRQGTADQPGSATELLRWSKVGCYAIAAREGCVYHSCQSVRGFSGAPIFSMQGETMKWVGLQTEGNGAGGSCTVEGLTRANIGVAASRILNHPPGS